MQHDRRWAKSAQRDLRGLLNEWDPAGIHDPSDDEPWPDDEYDCLLGRLLTRLLRGDGRADVAQFLRQELEDHFGLPSWLVTTSFIDRLFTWWESAR
jgi:hypothetical protein